MNLGDGGDGGGMQFVAFEARDPVEDTLDVRRNPFLSRSDMRAVLARIGYLCERDEYNGRSANTVSTLLEKSNKFLKRITYRDSHQY